jgi:hypothetical protein
MRHASWLDFVFRGFTWLSGFMALLRWLASRKLVAYK